MWVTYLASGDELVAVVKDGVGQTGVEGVLQVELVALEHAVRVLAAPPHHHPREVVLDHRDHRVRQHPLLSRQSCPQNDSLLSITMTYDTLPKLHLGQKPSKVLGIDSLY